MKFVVDTNVLLTFFWPNSFSKKIISNKRFKFFAPEYALEEVNKHTSEILKKTRLSRKQFKELRRDLAIYVEFISIEEYSKFLEKVSGIPDKEDVDFIALSLKLNAPIWSNDKDFKEQSLVPVFTTKELIELLDFP